MSLHGTTEYDFQRVWLFKQRVYGLLAADLFI